MKFTTLALTAVAINLTFVFPASADLFNSVAGGSVGGQVFNKVEGAATSQIQDAISDSDYKSIASAVQSRNSQMGAQRQTAMLAKYSAVGQQNYALGNQRLASARASAGSFNIGNYINQAKDYLKGQVSGAVSGAVGQVSNNPVLGGITNGVDQFNNGIDQVSTARNQATSAVDNARNTAPQLFNAP